MSHDPWRHQKRDPNCQRCGQEIPPFDEWTIHGPNATHRVCKACYQAWIDAHKAWAAGDQKSEPKSVYRCPVCGGERVQGVVWIELNTDEVQDSYSDEVYFCADCDLDETDNDGHLQRIDIVEVDHEQP